MSKCAFSLLIGRKTPIIQPTHCLTHCLLRIVCVVSADRLNHTYEMISISVFSCLSLWCARGGTCHPYCIIMDLWCYISLSGMIEAPFGICYRRISFAFMMDNIVMLLEAAKRGNDEQVRHSFWHKVSLLRTCSLQVKKYLESGAHVDTRDSLGCTALHWAASGGHFDCVKCLMDAGADVNVAGVSGDTPLHKAAVSVSAIVLRPFSYIFTYYSGKTIATLWSIYWSTEQRGTREIKRVRALGDDLWWRSKGVHRENCAGFEPLQGRAPTFVTSCWARLGVAVDSCCSQPRFWLLTQPQQRRLNSKTGMMTLTKRIDHPRG